MVGCPKKRSLLEEEDLPSLSTFSLVEKVDLDWLYRKFIGFSLKKEEEKISNWFLPPHRCCISLSLSKSKLPMNTHLSIRIPHSLLYLALGLSNRRRAKAQVASFIFLL